MGEMKPTDNLWAIFDSEGFYGARESEDAAKAFCERYNARADDPLKPYTYHRYARSLLESGESAASSELHQRIMNLPPRLQNASYLAGHRDARHAAAELVAASTAMGDDGPLPVE